MRSEAIALIKQATEKKFGKKIFSYKECVELNQDIYKTTGQMVSIPTLRRVFGLIKSSSLPSFSTLQSLASYCGYESVNEILDSAKADNDQDNNSLVKYISFLFKEINVNDPYDATYTNLVYHTIHFLDREPKLVEPVQKAIAKTKNGQAFYFERFIHTDQLNGYYGSGLGYYLTENKSLEGQVFGHSLLAFRYWLTMEETRFQKHASAVLCVADVASHHPFIGGRYFSTLLYKTKLENGPVKAVLKEARDYYLQIQSKAEHYQRFPSFEVTMATCMLLVEEWEEVLFYVNRGFRKKEHGIFSFINRPFLQTFYLYKAFGLFKTGKVGEANDYYDKINSTEFYFLAKKFHSILYIKLGAALRKIKADQKQLTHLLSETGFKRLELFR